MSIYYRTITIYGREGYCGLVDKHKWWTPARLGKPTRFGNLIFNLATRCYH